MMFDLTVRQIFCTTRAAKLNTEIAEKIVTGEDIPSSYVNLQGKEVYGSFLPLFEKRYFLINEISKKEMLRDHFQLIKIIILITCMIFLVGIALTILASKHFLRPFTELMKAIQGIKGGNYDTQLNPCTFKKSPYEVKQLINVFNDMTATINKNYQTLQMLSSTDGLTGIANRRVFEDLLEREWRYAIREQTPLSVVILDIDFFKEFNDTYGHLAGDDCLKNVSQVIKQTLKRPRDIVARYGGEEFVVILPETNLDGAYHVAEKIQEQFRAIQIPHKGNKAAHFVTASIGVAGFIPTKSMKKEDLIELADQALYEAKSQGKNRIVTKTKS